MRGTAAAAAHNTRNRRIEPEADGNARAGRAPLAKREPWTSSRREAAAPGAEADTLYVNARQVQYELSVMAAHKGFWSYLLFFVSFIALVSHRLDIDEGRSTLSWYGDAVSSTYDMANGEAGAFCLPNLLGGAATVDCYTPFTELQSDADLSGFVQADLSRYIAGIKAFCPDCGVAVTVSDQDLFSMSTDRVICSDFEMPNDEAANAAAQALLSFPSRDCAGEDAQFRKEPTPFGFPCCDSTELRLASLVLKVIENSLPEGAPDGLTIEQLSDDATLQDAAEQYVKLVLTAGNSVAQVIVRRDEHFVGIVYRAAWVQAKWVPGLVETSVRYWTRRYAPVGGGADATDNLFLYVAVVGFVLSTLHELIDLPASSLSWGEGARKLITPYSLLVWLPSIVVPWWLTLIGRLISLSEFPTVVVAVELVMFARLFVEGDSLAPFRLIVRTLLSASRQLLSFCVAMATTIAVFATMNAQLSGAFDDEHGTLSGALSSSFHVVIEGASLGTPRFAVIPGAALAMYYVLNVFLFLILAQFFIAILVNAFDATREQQSSERHDRQLPHCFMPAASAEPASRRLLAEIRISAVYYATYFAYGRPVPRLQRQLLQLVRGARALAEQRAEEAGEEYEELALMVTLDELAEAVDARAAAAMGRQFGARVRPGHEAEVAAFSLPPRALQVGAEAGAEADVVPF